MRILSIDAATKALGVAVVEADKVLATAELNIGKTHSERLLPLLRQLLQTADIAPQTLDYLAVTVGPGSFTGLRIGISTAKALAYAWDKPLIPVLTLDALSLNVQGFDKIACPILDARKNEVYYGIYAEDGSRLEDLGAMAPELLVKHLADAYPNRQIVLLGDGADQYYPLFNQVLAENVELMPAQRRYFLADSAALWAAAHLEARCRRQRSRRFICACQRQRRAERRLKMPELKYQALRLTAENVDTYIDQMAVAEAEIFAEAWSKEEYLRDIKENPLACYVILAQGDQLLAYGNFWLIGDEGDINNIAVLPAYRGLGLGKVLMRELQSACKALGGGRMTLEVRVGNKRAIELYLALGYQIAGRRPHYYLDNGEDALIMWLEEL